ncbi:MAG: phosphate regulon sensor histidine kinase PhoR [Pseudomonadota bacterium]
MSWLTAAVRIAAILLILALFGWIYGYPLQCVLVGLLCIVAFWLYQMRQADQWLANLHVPPPDLFGAWGDLLRRVYADRRVHRETQDKLQANVNYLQSSFAAMRDGVVMVDAQGAIKWMNHAVGPMLGLHPEDAGQTLTNLARAPEFNQYFLQGDYSKPLQYANGETPARYLRVEITYFGEGERLLFVRDVSEAVRLEKVRRDFVANVSHELRTPLTVISGYLATFLGNRGDFPDRYEKPMRQMSQQADRMENLLKDLLWLSRIESESHGVDRELVDVGGLLQELREELLETNPKRQLALSVDTCAKVLGDYREVYSAIVNLAGNALKYSAEDSPVQITWRESGNECVLDVVDEGIGIETRHIPRLTERFYRVDDSRASATGGTGLGLAIVKHVMVSHSGQLTIDSEPGRGSTFSLHFPKGDAL